MRKILQRYLAIFLSLLMTMSCLPLTALAEKYEQTENENVVSDAPDTPLADTDGISIVPYPNFLEEREGIFTLNADTKIVYEICNIELRETAEFLQETIRIATGMTLAVEGIYSKNAPENAIFFSSTAIDSYGEEGYVLEVAENRVMIRAYGNDGAFYGMQSFLQLLPTEIFSTDAVSGIDWVVPCVYIKDKPAYGWRGFMLDCHLSN